MDRPGTEELSDLAAKARAGDVDARNRIVESHLYLVDACSRTPRILHEVGFVGMSPDLLGDLKQEGSAALIAAVRNWKEGLGSFEKYAITAICRSFALWVKRRRRRMSSLDEIDPRGTFFSDPFPLADAMIIAEEEVTRILSVLPEDQRDVSRLRFVDGATVPEAAEVLGVTPEVVAGAEQKARRALRLHGGLGRTSSNGRKHEDLTGRRFGMLVVECVAGWKESGGEERRAWRCRCDCGGTTEVLSSYLRRDNPNCGCARAEGRNARAMRIDAGGRSLTIRDWSRECGLAMNLIRARLKNGWSSEDAVSVPANYGNRKPTRIIEAGGRSLTLSQWAKETGISKRTIRYRVESGWKPEDAVSVPAGNRGRKKAKQAG